MISRWKSTGFALLLLHGSSLWSCTLVAPSQWQLSDYDPLASHAQVSTQLFQIRAVGQQGCSGSLLLEMDGPQSLDLSNGGQQLLRFEVHRQTGDGGPIALSPQVAQQFSLSATTGASLPTFNWPISIHVPPQQWLAAGTYQRVMRLLLQDASGRAVDEKQIRLVQEIRPRVSLGIGQLSRSEANIDFGQLEKDKLRTILLLLRHNTPYTLQITSQHQGQLRNTSYPHSAVAYSLTLNQQDLQPAGTMVITGSGHSESGVSVHELAVKIKQVERVLAGTYQDNLTIVIFAR